MDAELVALVREQKDRQDIYDCIMRYCRGVDRLDRELLLSAYHPDGVDDHGMFIGTAPEFADWVLKLYAEYKHASHHDITNHYCEFDGDTAHVESYWISTTIDAVGPPYSQARGRYIDRFERRDGRWGIAHRVCLVEITTPLSECDRDKLARQYQPRDRTDLSYIRPLSS